MDSVLAAISETMVDDPKTPETDEPEQAQE